MRYLLRMRFLSSALIALILVAGAENACAAELNCSQVSNVEDFRYTWRVKGGLRWVAGLFFPTSGVGTLKTLFPNGTGGPINSELLITSNKGRSGGFFLYESEMDPAGQRTLMTYSGYAWGKKARHERTHFDYAKRLARMRRETPEKVENKVRPMPDAQLRDVLTAIHFLRQNATRITGPITTDIYADGKEYPVVFRPIGRKSFTFAGKRVPALGFEIKDAPGGKKWPGGVRVWLSDDSRRIPFRIEIQHSLASLQLDLKSIESCAFMQASK